MAYTLITANRNYSSWSLRPWVLMTTLGIPFIDRIEPFSAMDNHAAFRAFSPTGQVPVLLDGELRLFETLAICRHLDRQLAPERGGNPEQDAWSSALLTTVDTHLVRRYLLRIAGPRPEPFRTPEEQQRALAAVDATLGVLDRQLGDQRFLCGAEFSLPDALLVPMLDYLEPLPVLRWQASWPRLAAYLDRLRARPSGQAILVATDLKLR